MSKHSLSEASTIICSIGRQIIDVDESTLKFTDHRKRGWVKAGDNNQSTSNTRLASVNIIAALSNKGQLFFTTNRGKTNSVTFNFFLSKLCSHLDGGNQYWRRTTIILLDNATYHRSNETMDHIRSLRLPILYLGPYHYRMAPVEMLFNVIKSHDLNPLCS